MSGRQSLEQEQIVLMSERNSRSSTRRQTEALNEKIRHKEEIESEKLISAKYSELIKREQDLYDTDALELAKYTSDVYGVDSSSSSSEEKSTYGSPTESLDWDPVADLESPEKEEDCSIFPDPVLGRSETWSTGINQFFPEPCISTPICLTSPQRLTLEFTGTLHDILEDLEDSLEDSVFLPNETEEQVSSLIDNLIDTIVVEPPNGLTRDLTMDNPTYEARLKDIKRHISKEIFIDTYPK